MSRDNEALIQEVRGVEASLISWLSIDVPMLYARTARRHSRLDRWILASSLQKCIRRGLVQDAIDVALALHALDPDYAWRRLRVISLEDVGLGDIKAVSGVLAVAGKKVLRSALGDSQLYVHLARLLAVAIKDRTACDLINWVSNALPAEHFRNELLKVASTTWEEVAVDDEVPVWKRVVALQLLSGYSAKVGVSYRIFSRSHPSAVVRVIESLKPDPMVSFALLRGKGSESLNIALLFAYLLWKKASRRALVSLETEVRGTVRIGGVIAPSFCMYTRVGLHAMRIFLSGDAMFRSLLEQAGATNALKVLGLLLFQIESGVLDRVVDYAPTVRVDAEHAELARFGVVDDATCVALRMELLKRMSALNKARRMAWNVQLDNAGLPGGSV